MSSITKLVEQFLLHLKNTSTSTLKLCTSMHSSVKYYISRRQSWHTVLLNINSISAKKIGIKQLPEKTLFMCAVDRYFIGSTTQTYVVTLNSTMSQYSVEVSARGAALPLGWPVNASEQQVVTNCSQLSDCELEFVSPLVDSWHYLTVNNWLNETSVVSLHVGITRECRLI